MTRIRTNVVAAAVLACCVATTAFAAQNSTSDYALQGFVKAAEDYTVLRWAVEQALPPLENSADARKVSQQRQALADAIRAARPAREGDLIDRCAGFTLRRRIHAALGAHGTTAAIGAMRDSDFDEVPLIAVNGSMPWWAGSYMPVTVLAALPPLPFELQYRFIGRDLVVVDVDASLIVDILRDVLEPAVSAW